MSKMKEYLTKCKRCKKKFRAKRGGFLKRIVRDDEGEKTVYVPWYGKAGVKCPRCGSTETKTIAVLNIK